MKHLKLQIIPQYGFQAGVFTESIENALKAARTIEAGSVIINRQPHSELTICHLEVLK